MARMRMVTRTVNLTVATIMGLRISKAAVETVTVELSGIYAKPEDVVKAYEKTHNDTDFKAVSCTAMEVKEILYGMPEDDFIRMAKVLPPRTGAKSEDTEA